MTNIEIAKLLRKVAAIYTLEEENRFKIIAYENAATAVEHSTSEIKDLWDDGKLDDLPGIGPSLLEHFHELFTKGKVKHWEDMFKRYPGRMFTLLDVPGIGPKTAYKIVTQKNYKLPEKLAKSFIAHENGVKKDSRLKIDQADTIAKDIIEYLGEGQVLGSLRRRVSTIGDIDIAVPTLTPESVIEKFIQYPHSEVIEKGPTGASIRLSSDRQVDLRVVNPKQWGSMLQYFTGSKYHNIKLRELAIKKGLKINEYGISGKEFDNEKDFYNYLGLEYIPPELREDQGELETAMPELIEIKDVKGDLQTHSSYAKKTSHDSGESSLSQMAEFAIKLGYEYLGISDHNPSIAKHTKGQMVEELKRRSVMFKNFNTDNNSIRLINLLEVDIEPSGELPVPIEALEYLDAFLISIHSSFDMDKEKMTDRVLKAFEHPKAKIFAHPTGRKLGKREGYELNWDRIFEFCLKFDKAVEINGYPDRLDLPDVLVREAVKRGVKLSLGTDSHVASDLPLMRYAVDVARRGWSKKSDIINCLGYDKLMTWFRG